MHRLTSHFLMVAAVIAGFAPSALAAQDATAEAEKLIRHGVELRRTHDDDAAQREFQKAYDLVHTPRAAGQLGLAEQALGRWEDAERHVSEAIHAPADPWVVKNRTALDQALNTIQAHLGRIEVIGDVNGASVSVNARDVGRLPLPEPVRVSAGQVDIQVTAPGYTPVLRTVTIVGGQYQKVVVHLAKETATAVPEPAASNGGEPAAPAQPAPPAVEPQPESSSVRPVLKWTAAGLAGAGLVTGIVFTVLHGQANDKFSSDGCYNRNGTGVDKTGLETSTCHSDLGTLKTDQVVAIVGYVAAGAFAATWLVLQLTEPASNDAPAEHASRGPLCLPALSGVGVSCALRF